MSPGANYKRHLEKCSILSEEAHILAREKVIVEKTEFIKGEVHQLVKQQLMKLFNVKYKEVNGLMIKLGKVNLNSIVNGAIKNQKI